MERKTRLTLLIIISGVFLNISCSRKIHPVSVPASYVTMKLKIDTKKFKHLSLFATLDLPGNYTNGWETAGVSTDGYKWTFIVPDSINKITRRYFVRTQPFDFGKNEEKILAFSSNKISEQFVKEITLRDKITSIKGKYTDNQVSDTFKGFGYALVDAFVMNPIITSDIIDIELKDEGHKSELEIQLSYPCFETNKSYTFERRLEIIKKYPYSTYLFNTLPYLTKTFDKKALNLLFESFSSENRLSQYGKNVFDLINIEIQPVLIDTLSLVNAKDGMAEAIIRTYSKYTLIIFSASWCSPCHKQIPLLKEVFNDVTVVKKRPLIIRKAIETIKAEVDPWVKYRISDKVKI